MNRRARPSTIFYGRSTRKFFKPIWLSGRRALMTLDDSLEYNNTYRANLEQALIDAVNRLGKENKTLFSQLNAANSRINNLEQPTGEPQ